MKIKKDDKVVVLSGKDKGKQGKVLIADPKGAKVVVEGVNVATKHQKPRKQGEEGGIIKVETPIYVSKVQLVCPDPHLCLQGSARLPQVRQGHPCRLQSRKRQENPRLQEVRRRSLSERRTEL